MSENHRADSKRFLDERFSGDLTPSGHNPATLLEKPVVDRIIESYFFKEQVFATNEEDIVDRVVSHVSFIGGTYGDAQRPTPFLCLILRLLELRPSDEHLRVYLDYGGEKWKYLRALALFYIRLTRPAKQVYEWLEPYLEDKRKLKRRARTGTTLTYMDSFVDDLLTKERVCATTLWKMPTRAALEDFQDLEPRVSPLGDIDALLEEDNVEMLEDEDEEVVSDREHDRRRGDSPGSEFGEVVENGGDTDMDARKDS